MEILLYYLQFLEEIEKELINQGIDYKKGNNSGLNVLQSVSLLLEAFSPSAWLTT